MGQGSDVAASQRIEFVGGPLDGEFISAESPIVPTIAVAMQGRGLMAADRALKGYLGEIEDPGHPLGVYHFEWYIKGIPSDLADWVKIFRYEGERFG